MQIVRAFSLCFVILGLTGCSVTPTLVDRTTGQFYSGRTTGTAFSNSGEIETVIDGEKFSGEWTYMPGGTVGDRSTTLGGDGRIWGSGRGLASMKGDRGSTMRCIFEYQSTSATGIGECTRSDGRLFDLTMRLK